MKRLAEHKVLVAGDSFEHCRDQVEKFFALTSLVIYDCIETRREFSRCALEPSFATELAAAEERNRLMVASLVGELEKLAGDRLASLRDLPQGYASKTLHILSHFLDGFIGIDSFFYNLLDDSHWLPSPTRQRIVEQPGQHWLLHLDCYSATPEEAGILRL